jgi:hypothetical protein
MIGMLRRCGDEAVSFGDWTVGIRVFCGASE